MSTAEYNIRTPIHQFLGVSSVARIVRVYMFLSLGICSVRADTQVPGKPYPKSFDSVMGAVAVLHHEYEDSDLIYFHMEPASGGTVLGIVRLDNKGSYALMVGGDCVNMECSFTINGKAVRLSERLLFNYLAEPVRPPELPKIISSDSPRFHVFTLKEGDECEVRISEDKQGKRFADTPAPSNGLSSPQVRAEHYRQTLIVGRNANSEWFSKIVTRDIPSKCCDRNE